jgi:hypothetical protein
MVGEILIGKYSERSNLGLNAVGSRNLTGETEENHEDPESE